MAGAAALETAAAVLEIERRRWTMARPRRRNCGGADGDDDGGSALLDEDEGNCSDPGRLWLI